MSDLISASCANLDSEHLVDLPQRGLVAHHARLGLCAMEETRKECVKRGISRMLDLAHALSVGMIRATVLREPTNVHRVPLDTSHPEMPTQCEQRAQSASPDRRATAQAV